MKRNRVKQKPIAEINITPFTDVILVLLVIFMITTPLIFQSNIKVNLPEASTKDPLQFKRQINITITNEGLTYLDRTLVTQQELREKVTALYKNNKELSVVLLSDQSVRFKDIVTIFDLLTQIGIKNLNIATKTGKIE